MMLKRSGERRHSCLFPDISGKEKKSFSPLCSESRYCHDFYSFIFVKVCFVAQNVLYLGEYSIELEKNKLLLLDEVAYRCQLDPVD